MQYYTDQNPGILALHSSYRGLEGSSEAVPGIPAGCYRIVSYRTRLHPLRISTVTTHAVPVTIPVPNPHGVPVSLSLSLSLPPLAHLLLPVFPLFLFLFFFLFFSFLSFLSSPSYHRGFSQLCLDIDRLFPFFWPPQPVFGVLSHGRRQTVRRLWPPESLLRFLAILLYLLLSTLLRLDSIESSSSWCS